MMGIRIPLVLAVLLIALLSLVNVSAYKRGAVTAPTSMTVVTSGSAQLAITAGPGNAGNQVTSTGNGVVKIDFRKGNLGTIFGLKPGDLYRMRQVLVITNTGNAQGADCHDVSVYVSGGTPLNLTDIYGRLTSAAPNGTALWNSTTGKAGTVKLQTTAPNNQMYVDFWWSATQSVTTAGNFTVEVNATKSATCP